MKISFNPPLKAEARTINVLPLITCPKCGSSDVYSQAFVTVLEFVNLNSGEFLESPTESDDVLGAREKTERFCYDCQHEWEVEDESNN